MRRPGPPDDGTPLWLAIVLFAVFGITMFLAGYMFCRSFL